MCGDKQTAQSQTGKMKRHLLLWPLNFRSAIITGEPMPSSHDPRQNRLLSTLTAAEFARLGPLLEPVALATGEVLHQCNGKLTHVYFPTTAVVPIQYELADGGACEIASVGSEGVLGVSLFM